MKQLTLIMFLYLIAGLSSGCEGRSREIASKSGYQKITAGQAKAIMDDGNPYMLVDVRTKSEYAAQHIKGALLIPNNEIKARAETELPDKNARILVYCRSGNRSASAARTLIDLGYTNVNDFGGIINWPYGTTIDKNAKN